MSRQPDHSAEFDQPTTSSSDRATDRSLPLEQPVAEQPQTTAATQLAMPNFQRMVEGISKDYFFYATDVSGLLTYVSPSVKEVLGFEPADVLGMNWREFVETNSPTLSSAESVERLALIGEETSGTLVETTHFDGSVKVIEAFPRAIFDDSGEVIGTEGICKDVTELKHTEEELLESSAELDRRVKQRTAELEHRLEYEELLVSLSTGFVSTGLTDRGNPSIEDRLQKALGQIGEFTGIDRCYIYEFSDDLQFVSLIHEWCAPGIPSLKSQMQRVSASEYKWPIEKLKQRRPFSVSDSLQLHGSQSQIHRVYQRLGIRSMLNVPMHRGANLVGTLGLSCHLTPKDWSKEDIALLQVLAEVLNSAIDRDDAETRLRDSETRFRSVVQDQSDLIVRWRLDGSQTFVNQAVCRFLGATEQEVLNLSVYDRIHPEDREAVRRKIAALTLEKPYASDEHRVIRSNGEIAWMQWIDRALFDESGKLIEFQSVGRDVTALKNAQHELRRRLEFERLVLSLSLQFINMPIESIDDALTDALQRVSRFTEVDRSFVTLADETFETAHMRYSWNNPEAPYIPPEIREIAIDNFPWAKATLSRGYSIHVPNLSELPPEAYKLREVLESINVKSYVNVPLKVGDRLIGYLGFLTFHQERSWSPEDIALLRVLGEVFVNAMQRREVETALQLSEERSRLTIEGIEEGLFDWRVQTGEVYVSDYLLRSQGLPEGKNNHTFDAWFRRILPEDRDMVRTALDKHLSGETPTYEAEYRIKHFDGSIRWGHARGRVVEHDQSGVPTRMVGVDRDITDRVQQRRRMQELESQLVHLGRIATTGETVAGIAHEVNQPLHAAATFAAAARAALKSGREGGIEKGIELAQKMSDQVTRAGDIIRRLREFTRPRPGDYTRVGMNDIVRESAAFFSHITPGNELRIEYDLDPSLSLIQGDDVQLQQVLVNLLQNAYESMVPNQRASDSLDTTDRLPPAKDPRIRVTTRQWSNALEVRVADNGHSCPDEKISNLFDPFYTTKPNGMGIGLALCHSIIQAHRGQIEAINNAAGGMTFAFTLPTIETPPQVTHEYNGTATVLAKEDQHND